MVWTHLGGYMLRQRSGRFHAQLNAENRGCMYMALIHIISLELHHHVDHAI